LAPGDDDPLVNPALREYLQRSFGVALPELPPSDAITEEYDLQVLFRAVSQAVAAQEQWAIKTDIFLGLFSFQKFVMYKDLEGNTPAFLLHRLIRRLVTRAGGSVIGIPTLRRYAGLAQHRAEHLGVVHAWIHPTWRKRC